jgi:ketosteroid isomerase-like protein
MSRQNVEVVRRLHAAGMRLDVEAFVECCHPELEWEENTPFYPGLRSRYLGHEGAREWFTDALVEPWSEMRLERLEFLEADQDHAVVDFVFAARGRTSGVETRLRIWQVFWFREGKITKRQLFSAEAEALEAVGLRE